MLRAALANTKKLELTALVFISKMKGFASELAAAGRVISDEEINEYVLPGLDGEYNAIVASVNANPSTSFADVCNQLTAYDYRQHMLSESGQSSGSFQSSVHAASRHDERYDNNGGGYRHNNHGGGRHHQRGRSPRRHNQRYDNPSSTSS
jgi:hypothetical protein